MNYKEHAKNLLTEYNLCVKAKPKSDAINIQLEKDSCSIWAVHLNYILTWGNENELAEACHQLESRLKPLKEKIILEVLQNGTV